MSKKRFLIPDGIYHVYNRGNNHMFIFKDDQDFFVFLRIIKKFKEIYNIEIYAICLMNNHFHLLLRDIDKNLSRFMRQIQSCYAIYFNKKYKFDGHVFQGIFHSEIISNATCFFRKLRYINRNPIKAGITSNIFEYPWAITEKSNDRYKLIDFNFIDSEFEKWSKTGYYEYLSSESDDIYECLVEISPMTMSEAESFFNGILARSGLDSSLDFDSFEDHHKSLVISQARYYGISLRQLETLTGMTIYRLIKFCKNIPEYV
ncbi:MAG: transposase [Clostridia bacterium]